MRVIRFLHRHPLLLLGAIAVAFVGWIWWDAIPARQPDSVVGEARGLHDANGPLRGRDLPQPPEFLVGADFLTAPTTDADVPTAPKPLAKLKPGMPRAEVEKL